MVFQHSKKEKPGPVLGEQEDLCAAPFNTQKIFVGTDWVASAAEAARIY